MQTRTSRHALALLSCRPRSPVSAASILLLGLAVTHLSIAAPLTAQISLGDLNRQPGRVRSSQPKYFTQAGADTYFIARHHNGGNQLFVTRGTTATTRRIDLPGASPSPTDESAMLGIGNRLFFAGANTAGSELWVTDGTPAGTKMLRDLVPGPDYGSPKRFTQLGNRLVFVANAGSELWASDGTTAGTVLLAKLRVFFGGEIEWLTPFRGRIWFSAPLPGGGGRHLWSTDGTPAGTRVETLGRQALSPAGNTVVGSNLFFLAESDPLGPSLWATDGTQAGTRRLTLVSANPRRRWAALGNRLVFPTTGFEVWVSDGTTAGTTQLRDFGRTLWPPGDAIAFNQQAYFSAAESATGAELWATDGTVSGTRLVRDILPGPNSSQPNELTVFGRRLYFTAVSNNQFGRIWSTDGTTAGTRELAPLSVIARHLFAPINGNQILMSAADSARGTELWRTNGTVAGTQLVADLDPQSTGDSGPFHAAALGQLTLFVADDGINGRELWRTDGTRAGTMMVTSIFPTGRAQISHLTRLGDRMYFAATDGHRGIELWSSNGTATGTQIVVDLVPGPGSSGPIGMTVFGGQLYFGAAGGLWRSDGTAQGTIRLAANIGYVGRVGTLGGALFFSATDSTHGRELWKTNGTAAGTQLVRDVNPGIRGSSPAGLGVMNGRLWFSAFHPAAGNELWTTDGTTAGTAPLLDIEPGQGSSSPTQLHILRPGYALFGAYTRTTGRELWRTDGTAAGTQLLVDRVPGIETGALWVFGKVNDRIVFLSHDGRLGFKLYSTDGTVSSIRKLPDINPYGTDVPFTTGVIVGGRFLYLPAHDGSGIQLWRTDGMTTRLAANFWPGPFSSSPSVLALGNGQLMVSAHSPGIGREPWLVRPGAIVDSVGQGCGAPSRTPELVSGHPILGQNWTLEGRNSFAGAVGTFLVSPLGRPSIINHWPCDVVVDPARTVILSSAPVRNRAFRSVVPLPNAPALRGLTIAVQAVAAPTDAPGGVDLTNGLYATMDF